MKRTNDSQAHTKRPHKILLLLICAATISIAATIVEKLNAPRNTSAAPSGGAANPSVPPAADSSKPADWQPLVGRWVRMDTPYVFDITSVNDDGTLKAGYYNPRSINISRARAKDNEGNLTVFVELRNVNYPGSTYTLTYDSTKDLLRGVYYQAATGHKYDVMFSRIRQKS